MARHDWQGDDWESTCSKCRLVRWKYDCIPGYSYIGRVTGEVWKHLRTNRAPPCMPA